MKRILVIGCPGAGKTYFSKKLSQLLGLPVVHMDNLYWHEDKTCVSTEELKEKLLPYLTKDEWIIDGNYHKTLEMRLPYATDVFVLDISRKECIEGILERIDQPRDDIPWIETEEDHAPRFAPCRRPGAWIETYYSTLKLSANSSPLVWGAWIETGYTP